MEKYPEFFTKKSNTRHLTTIIKQDPVINSDFLMGKGYHKVNDGIYKNLLSKHEVSR